MNYGNVQGYSEKFALDKSKKNDSYQLHYTYTVYNRRVCTVLAPGVNDLR